LQSEQSQRVPTIFNYCFLGEASKNKATEETEGKTEETPSSTEAPSKPKEEEEVREETV
jgi:hypothetical protein